MTIVVAFQCVDGVFIGADSMLAIGGRGLDFAHHKAKKVYVLPGDQVFGYAGDQGQGDRFRAVAETSHGFLEDCARPLDYGLKLTETVMEQFEATRIGEDLDINAILA